MPRSLPPSRDGRLLIPVLHLDALPGSPGFAGDFPGLVDRARREAGLLVEAGVDALILENHGDSPFVKDENPPAVVAAMAVIAAAIRRDCSLPLGINLLRNDAIGAISVCAATGASFVRVNVLNGVTATDQGLIEGRGREVVSQRNLLAPEVALLADLDVKFGTPLYRAEPETAAPSLLQRGGADALIVTGPATGKPVDRSRLEAVRQAVGKATVLVGSGATAASIRDLLTLADGVIVGSDLKVDGKVENPVDPHRLRRFVDAFRDR